MLFKHMVGTSVDCNGSNVIMARKVNDHVDKIARSHNVNALPVKLHTS
jgi:hypothetical protein